MSNHVPRFSFAFCIGPRTDSSTEQSPKANLYKVPRNGNFTHLYSPAKDGLYLDFSIGRGAVLAEPGRSSPCFVRPAPARVVCSNASVPGAPLSLVERPGKRHTVPSVVHIPHGSSLLNIQSQYHSSDDSSVSPSPPPPESRGRTTSGNSRRQPRPTPSPTRPTSINTRSRTQRHHAPARSPGRQTTPNISDWTVASLQKAPRDKGIPFHRTDNKAKLFKILTTECCTSSSDSGKSSSGDVIARRLGAWHRDASATCCPLAASTAADCGGGIWHRDASASRYPLAAAAAASGTGMPAPPAAPLQHPQQPMAAADGSGVWHRDASASCCPLAAVAAADRSGVWHRDASATRCPLAAYTAADRRGWTAT